MVALGGVDAGWDPGGSRIGEKSSWLSDDSATSSSETFSNVVSNLTPVAGLIFETKNRVIFSGELFSGEEFREK